MEQFFEPKSMVIIGVSDSKLSLGRIVFQNAFRLGFAGDVFGVGSYSEKKFADHMVRSIADLPDGLDLAVVLTPAASLPEILEQCGQKGIRSVVIETAGFSEFGDSTKSLESEIVTIARSHSMRLMGPNCVGTINVKKGLFLPFAPVSDLGRPGQISLISQSGGVGTNLYLRLGEEALGLSKFAFVGNKLDLDEVDFLDYLLDDPDTSVIGMYLESIGRGRALFDVMRRSQKPIVVMKSNRSEGTAKSAQSHTAALSSDDDVVDAAIRQAGAIRVNTATEMIDTLKALSLPPMKGDRVAILSRSGGHAVVTVDACLENSLKLAQFPQAFLDALSELFHSRVILRQNPLDLGEIFDYPLFAKIVARTLALDAVDGLIFNHIYVAGIESEPSRVFLKEVKKLQEKFAKPIVVTLATELVEVTESARLVSLPLFSDPESAVTALERSATFNRRMIAGSKLEPSSPKPGDFQALPAFSTASPSLPESFEILRRWDVPVADFRFVTDPNDACAAAEDLGFPVAVKLVSEMASHKTDVGGVALNVASVSELLVVLAEMTEKFTKKFGSGKIDGFCLQAMAEAGVEVIVGGRRDPQFGPVVVLGLGGVFVELIRDRTLRLAPISLPEARDMIFDLKGCAILQGYRGSQRVDIDGLAEHITRISWALSQFDEIAEIDLNPVKVSTQGVKVLDVRLSLAQ